MFPRFRHFRRAALLACLAGLIAAGPVDAGWMGFRNDTSATLVVQEAVAGGRSGKPQKVFANETVRDIPPAGAQRTFTITDPARPDRPLYTGRFPTPAENENVLYVIKSDGKGGLLIEAIRSPAGVSRHTPKR
jgi:hypothetical protein